MPTKTCPACASSNVMDAAFCSQCGSPFEPKGDTPSQIQTPPVEPIVDPKPAAPPSTPAAVERAYVYAVQPDPPLAPEKKEMPCLVKAAGGFFGCLFGLLIGLCLSLICVMPVTYAIGGGGGSPVLEGAIIIIVILVIITTILGIINGPGFLGKILTSIGDTFRWMTGSGRGNG
jgi:hypothetical protein